MNERIKKLREEAAAALQSSRDLIEQEEPDLAGSEAALQTYRDKTAEADKLQAHADAVQTAETAARDAEEALRGRAPRAAARVNADAQQQQGDGQQGQQPAGDVQRAPGDPAPRPHELNRRGEPVDWIQGLPACAQLPDVFTRASDALQAQGEAQYEAFLLAARGEFEPGRVALALQGVDPQIATALQEINTGNAYTIPTALLPTPIDAMGVRGRLGELCERVVVNEIQGKATVFGSVAVAGYAEAGAPGNSEPSNSEIDYELFPMGAYADFTNLSLAGSAFDLIAQFSQAVGRAMGRAIDQYIISGNANNQFEGLLQANNTIPGGKQQIVATSGEVAWDDIAKLAGKLGDEFVDDATFVSNLANMLLVRVNDVNANKGNSRDDLFGPVAGFPAVRSQGGTWGAASAANGNVAILGAFRNYALFEQPGAPMMVSSGTLLNQAAPKDQTRVAIRQYRDGRRARIAGFSKLVGKA